VLQQETENIMKIKSLSVVLILTVLLAGCSAAGRPAAGQSWIVDSMTVDATQFDLTANQPLTLEFTENNQVGGSSGCNAFFGELQFKADGKVVAGMFGGTEMACEVGMDVEAAYLGALSRVDSYEYSQYVLTLTADDGRTELVFQLLRTE